MFYIMLLSTLMTSLTLLTAHAGWYASNVPVGSASTIDECYVTSNTDNPTDPDIYSLRRQVITGYNNSLTSDCSKKIKVLTDVDLTIPLTLSGSSFQKGFTLEGQSEIASDTIINLSPISKDELTPVKDIDPSFIASDSDTAESCALIFQESDNVTVKNITFKGSKDTALCVFGNRTIFENVSVQDNAGIGIHFFSKNNSMTKSFILRNAKAGIVLENAENTITHIERFENNGLITNPKHLVSNSSLADSLQPELSDSPNYNGDTKYQLSIDFNNDVNQVDLYRVQSGTGLSQLQFVESRSASGSQTVTIPLDGSHNDAYMAIAIAAGVTSTPSEVLYLGDYPETEPDPSQTCAERSAHCKVIWPDWKNTPADSPSVSRPDCRPTRSSTGGMPNICTDSDHDGILDVCEDKNGNCKFEKELGETDAEKADSDNDGLIDGLEDSNQDGTYDPLTETDPNNEDSDGDNLNDLLEYGSDGVHQLQEPDPRLKDTDGDGIDDDKELGLDGHYDEGIDTHVYLRDTDQDGVDDGDEDKNHDGKIDYGETDPRVNDTDGDGLWDSEDLCPLHPANNCDPNCSITDLECLRANCIPDVPPPANLDSDGDGLSNLREDINFNCRLDDYESDPYDPDTDDDKLNDDKELIAGTDPRNPDTDGDHIPDGIEDYHNQGTPDSDECNPLMNDTDEDGISDQFEDLDHDGHWDQTPNIEAQPGQVLNPTLAGVESSCYEKDSDGDGLDDNEEDINGNGRYDVGETYAMNSDSDGDGAPDNVDPLPLWADVNDYNSVQGFPAQGCALQTHVSWRFHDVLMPVILLGLFMGIFYGVCSVAKRKEE